MSKPNKFSWNHSSLVHQLIETVLAICSRFAKDNRASLDSRSKSDTIPSHTLTIGLHIKLLDVCREPEKSLAIRKDCTGVIIANVIVIETYQPQENWDVLRGILSMEEMLIN
jgi:hypothetical protein